MTPMHVHRRIEFKCNLSCRKLLLLLQFVVTFERRRRTLGRNVRMDFEKNEIFKTVEHFSEPIAAERKRAIAAQLCIFSASNIVRFSCAGRNAI